MPSPVRRLAPRTTDPTEIACSIYDFGIVLVLALLGDWRGLAAGAVVIFVVHFSAGLVAARRVRKMGPVVIPSGPPVGRMPKAREEGELPPGYEWTGD